MDLNRTTIVILIAVIGGLFAVLTYVDHSLALGITGLFTMGMLYWIGKEYVA